MQCQMRTRNLHVEWSDRRHSAIHQVNPGVTSSRAVVTVFAQFIVRGGKNKRLLKVY